MAVAANEVTAIADALEQMRKGARPPVLDEERRPNVPVCKQVNYLFRPTDWVIRGLVWVFGVDR
jgi:hypothetical protein